MRPLPGGVGAICEAVAAVLRCQPKAVQVEEEPLPMASFTVVVPRLMTEAEQRLAAAAVEEQRPAGIEFLGFRVRTP